MTLETYRRKRRFQRTPEPRAHVKHARGFSYVIQKHAASHLHYDFRLELGGVLLSWAVPKGPSLDPRDKRLAMQVEDHPVAYGAFEGTIPKGEYGGGTVMLWDRGTWEPEGDPQKDYARGRLTFTLHGEKLRGKWHLVRTAADAQGRKRWLLFKGADDEARRSDGAVVNDMPASVATGRSLDEIAADQDASWSSNRTPKKAARRGAPARVEPELATLAKEPPEGQAFVIVGWTDPKSSREDKAAGEIVLEKPKSSVTHPEKILYPDCGVTKGEVAEYLERVADWMLPHVAGRPLMLVRCPNGIGRCFVQKHAGLRGPDGARKVDVGDDEPQLVIDDARGLVGLAQAGVLEIHTWGSHVDSLERPDWLVFDLDPDPTVKWPAVVAAARLVRERLASLELDAFVKTTGGKGLHVCCAIEASLDWDAAKDFTRKVSDAIVREDPAHFVATMTKARRKGKIFIDYFRNGRGATFVAPFSPRARPGAPVAMPVSWDELDDIAPSQFTVRTAMKRLDALRSDPWPRPRTRKKSTSRSKG